MTIYSTRQLRLLALCLPVVACTGLMAFAWLQEKDNTLTAAEKKAGWVLLFDGKTTTNWKAYNNKLSDGWEVVNGELHCKENGVQNRADLITASQYENFELAFDWKIGKGFNSGVVYRVVESEHPSYESGPEYQLIDDLGYPDKLEDWQKSGADYAMHAPAKIVSKPAGEYNHTRIVVKGAHVEHWLNNVKVADFELWTPEWYRLKEKSKWKDVAAYGMAKKGYIGLQDHGGGIWFKNIKLKTL